MPAEPEFDLSWNAFLYIAGELGEEELADFERLLLEDQTAREAVARAVELVQIVGMIGPESGTRVFVGGRNSRRRRVAWSVSLAAAAALLAIILIPTFHSMDRGMPDTSQVARTWSGLRDRIDADWRAVVADSPPVESPDTSFANDSEETIDTSSERPLPSWLLSAASNRAAGSPREEN